jgi:TolB-like protein
LTRPSELITLPKKKPSWIPFGLGIVSLILAILVAYWGWNVLFQTSLKVGEGHRSIAVLPLKNISAKPDSDYFSDGLTEDIIARLTKISELKVISRTSVMLYKNTDKNLRQIGEELGVRTILEGSVRRAHAQVCVGAQLIDTQTDRHLWAATYDHQSEAVFAIQSDVAEQIALALQVELSTEERERMGFFRLSTSDNSSIWLLSLLQYRGSYD